MKWVNIEKEIITDGYNFNNCIDAPHITTLGDDGKYKSLDMVILDDLMITPILLLNKKGFITEWSCSGHLYENANTGYIRFIDDIFQYNDVIRPNKEIDLYHNKYVYVADNKTLRAKQIKDLENNISIEELNDSIIGFNKTVLEWAYVLPSYQNIIKSDITK